MKKHNYLLILICCFLLCSVAQQSYPFEEERATEDYSFFKDRTSLSAKEAISHRKLKIGS